ncbi:tat pathway signal sequence domain-containing protein [Teratosphaeria nubilosa]|uniref:Tat pathway signal sequence domain-containing protein n=1 Tax=Teratosphaeria nubilosa TaxID=161662 RepID=A0A6G1LIS4_9PEZI|nr:tat pathway signal sequence domain-containing protein [Teratosphaeria nubilosa]
MRLAPVALPLLLEATVAAAGCPYAGRPAAPAGCPYARNAESAQTPPKARRSVSDDKKGVFYMNRIGPSGSQLWIANADGSNATKLMGGQSSPFDYHASWSPSGEWIVFTTESRGPGQSDLKRVRPDGTGLESLVQTDHVEDSGVLSPDSSQVAYVSTYGGNYTTNIWVKDLKTNSTWNLTDTALTRADNTWPTGHYRPAYSPDGQWIAFSSDRNTDWTGHSEGVGWEHTQSLAVYMVRPNGSDFKTVARQEGYSLGTPQWSPCGKYIIYNNMTTEDTYGAHATSGQQSAVASNIYRVDVETGDVVALTEGTYLRVGQHYIGNSSNVGYNIKAGTNAGINYTMPDATHKYWNVSSLRSPSWSPDGSKILYEVLDWTQQPAELPLWSFDDEWEYRYIDVFPQHNTAVNRIATTQKVEGGANGSLVSFKPGYVDLLTALNSFSVWDVNNSTEVQDLYEGGAGAFQPTWNSDGTELMVGFGGWFESRSGTPATIYRAAVNGSWFYNMTDGNDNAGLPSWAPANSAFVYRAWSTATGVPLGLRVFNLTTGTTFNLTDGWDNTPGWSPDGELIVFSRNNNWTWSYGPRWYADRFDIYTIRPDGTDLHRVTDSLSNDAHCVWTHDNRIMWSTGMYGFKDESALFDNTFQPYGQIAIMDKDGSNKQVLVDTIWEDAMPLYLPKEYLTNYTGWAS